MMSPVAFDELWTDIGVAVMAQMSAGVVPADTDAGNTAAVFALVYIFSKGKRLSG